VARHKDRIRTWSGEKVKAHASLLVEYLIQLASETDPQKGKPSEARKDHKAWIALVQLRELAETLAGWAIDHQVGLALNRLKHLTPPSTAETRENPEYIDYLSQLNSHQNEFQGRDLKDHSTISAEVARRILINCVTPNPVGLDAPLNTRLVSALTALEFGETLELFEATDPYRKVRWEELQHQLRAVGLIEYRCGRGSKKHEAQSDVAFHFGVEKDTIRRWESYVRKDLGNLLVANAVDSARNAALLEIDANRGIAVGAPAGFWDEMYGIEALKAAGKAYLTFKGFKRS
jgi:hypothetical protein